MKKETEDNMKEKNTEEKMKKKIVPDTSILISGKFFELAEQGKFKHDSILLPVAVVDELQAQASTGKEIGFKGLEQIKKLRSLKGLDVEFSGNRPTLEEIQLARKGRIDALIRDVAKNNKAVLYTSDYVQALVGEAEGVEIEYIEQEVEQAHSLEKFFDDETQSVHLKVGAAVYAKKGKPGAVRLVKLREEIMQEEELTGIINEIVHRARKKDAAFIEISKRGALVIQMGDYRIAIASPPFSDDTELTAVRPTVRMKLSDYNMHKDLESAVVSGSRGILISGAPGSGKSSFASALADFIQSHGKIVKTFESPRDLQVGSEITQYGPLEGDWSKSAEILLLVRPDYTIFDEIRHTKDFLVYADMRLAGVGMIGVIHATTAVSAIQRFIGRIELGVIPHIVDTVIYIEAGQIRKVYELKLVVKMPTGMKEADLSRPVVEIRDHATKKLEYEIYTYGEEKVIIPVSENKDKNPLAKLVKEAIYDEIRKYDEDPIIEILSDSRIGIKMRKDALPRFIGKGGENIERVEKRLGIAITVEPKEGTYKDRATYKIFEHGKFLSIRIQESSPGEQVEIYSANTCIASMLIGKNNEVNVRKDSDIGKEIMSAYSRGKLSVVVG